MEEGFRLDPRLEQDTITLLNWPLCAVRLMDDQRFPWLVLVPKRAGTCELQDLSPEDQAPLLKEILTASQALQAVTGAEKMNIGLLGNIVPQLHVHVVARFFRDAAWPGPVWGHGARVPYEGQGRAHLIESLLKEFI